MACAFLVFFTGRPDLQSVSIFIQSQTLDSKRVERVHPGQYDTCRVNFSAAEYKRRYPKEWAKHLQPNTFRVLKGKEVTLHSVDELAKM